VPNETTGSSVVEGQLVKDNNVLVNSQLTALLPSDESHWALKEQ
jgi:hypothetical protein